MADNVTDPLEEAVLSGAIFAGPDPEGEEPYRQASDDDFDSDDGGPGAAGFPGGGAGGGPSMPSGPVKTTKGQSHNTGVKGVLADYRNRNNDKPSTSSKSPKAPSKAAFKNNAFGKRSKDSNTAELSDSSSLGLSDSEQDARDAYRRKRIEEMKQMGSEERRTSSSQQKFGHLREVGQSQFIKAIEDRNALCVVVHVYDPVSLSKISPQWSSQTHSLLTPVPQSIPSCLVINAHLSSLARRYPHTKFLRALSQDLEFAQGDEEDVLPTLLVYRQGDMFKNLVAFDRELTTLNGQDEEDEVNSDSISRDLVEQALIR